MNNIIHAWWPRSPSPGNFGDILTPLLMDKLFGYKCLFTPKPFNTPTLLGIGSIITHAENGSVVWGSGLIRESDGANLKLDAQYLAVRGPRTYEILRGRGIACNPIFGDPALLMPLVYKKPDDIEPKYEYGIFTHYVDYEQVSKWYADEPSVKVINPLNSNPLNVIDQVLQCERIISSSLHGVIIAHAYGIEAVWAKHSDKLNGDGIKFYDYFDSVDISMNCLDFQKPINRIEFSKFEFTPPGEIQILKLQNVMQAYLDARR